MGRFISRDSLPGFDQNPISNHKWLYAYGNPILWTDRSGLSPKVECSYIYFPDLKSYCEEANGNDNDPNTIDARWKFYDRLAFYSKVYGWGSEGCKYAGKMLEWFIAGNVANVSIELPSNTSFAKDPGILRATKVKMDKVFEDEPEDIRPLLYIFLKDHIQPEVDCTPFKLISNIYNITHKESWSGKYSPRPHDRGWWGAFGRRMSMTHPQDLPSSSWRRFCLR